MKKVAELSEQIRADFIESQKGKKLQVLIEQVQ